MSQPTDGTPGAGVLLHLPAIVAGTGGAALCGADGTLEELTRSAAAERFKTEPHLVCHAGFTARRLGLSEVGRRATGLPPHADVAELYAFVRPARPIIPSPAGLARGLGLDVPKTLEDAVVVVAEAARRLLQEIAGFSERERDECRSLAAMAGRSGWPWAKAIEAAVGAAAQRMSAFETWKRLPEWEERAPRGEPGSQPVAAGEARMWLAEILGPERERREARPRTGGPSGARAARRAASSLSTRLSTSR